MPPISAWAISQRRKCMSAYNHIKEHALAANRQLPQSGLVRFTFGNVSAADSQKGVFAIKPSGVPYHELLLHHMVIVDFDGQVVEGKFRPSSDTPTHAALYHSWPQLGGICHTHSKYATAWAQARKPIPLMGTTHADYLPADVPCIPFLEDELIRSAYEKETGNLIAAHFAAHHLEPTEVSMVLLPGHGPFTWGKDAAEALYHSEVLEYIAELALLTLQVTAGPRRLKPALINKHFKRKHGPDAYYGQ